MAKSRTDDNTDITRVEGAGFLDQYVEEDHSLDGMDEYVLLPKLKIIHGSSDHALKKQFGEGSAIIRPGDALVVKQEEGQDFLFVPQYFYVEWCKWSERDDNDTPNIMESSFDPRSPTARKAKDKDLRFELYEGHEDRPAKEQWNYRYVEHLRFPGVIYDSEHPLDGTTVVLSFEKGEHYQGQNFISAIKMRKRRTEEGLLVQIPLWAQVWQLNTAHRERGAKNWHGFDFQPAAQSVIDVIDVPAMKAEHERFKELHEANRLGVQDEDQDEGDNADTKEQPEF